VLVVWLAGACGDSGAPPGHDGDGGSSTRRLEIQAPPGDQLGLAFAETRALAVRLFDTDNRPLAGARVSFALVVAPGSDPAGAVLSAGEARTDASGIASVSVTGGATVASFRVQVEAENASPVSFFIVVSDEGFAALHALVAHDGDRVASDFASVQTRLYGGDQTCAMLDPAAPPDSSFPTRTVVFGEEAAYPQLPASLPYTLLAWGTGAAGQLLASGCVELSATQVMAGGTLRLDLPVVDRAEQLAPRYALVSQLELGALADLLFAGKDGWGAGACPLGAAQLLLDCAIDALDGGDALDCRVVNPGGNATTLQNARGPVDANGCRPATLAAGGMTLDALVDAAMASSGANTRFVTRAQTLTGLLAGLSLESSLDLASATHRLDAAHFALPGADFDIPLAVTARPIVVAHDVAIALGAGAAPRFSLASHGFTLRLGSLLRDGFAHFPPLPADGRLGKELVAGVNGPAGTTGCPALSAVACPAAGLGAACLANACTTSVPSIDTALARPFTFSEGSGLDFVWSGAATGVDTELDFQVESLQMGIWQATLTFADASTLLVGATFTGTAAP